MLAILMGPDVNTRRVDAKNEKVTSNSSASIHVTATLASPISIELSVTAELMKELLAKLRRFKQAEAIGRPIRS